MSKYDKGWRLFVGVMLLLLPWITLFVIVGAGVVVCFEYLPTHESKWHGLVRSESSCIEDNWFQGRALQTCVWEGRRYQCVQEHDDYECAEIK